MVEQNQTEGKWYCLDPPKNYLDNNKTKNPGSTGLKLERERIKIKPVNVHLGLQFSRSGFDVIPRPEETV